MELLTHLQPKYNTVDNSKRAEQANIAWTCGDHSEGVHKAGFYSVFTTTISGH